VKSHTLGVIVARFQVPDLSEGHRFLIESVLAMHEYVLVILGETPARLTQCAPMPYELREKMVREAYPMVVIRRIVDQPDDVTWSNLLDQVIRTMSGLTPILYCGRDSFASHYVGEYRVVELPPVVSPSGVEIRELLSPRNTSDFRAGVVWAAQYKFPTSYMCVDMAVIDCDGRLLVAKKDHDLGLRLPGGFVDVTDPTLEYAAQRELREETGIEPGDQVYLGTFRINDYRYRKAADKIMTALFVSRHCFGAPRASDDISECLWQPLNDATRAWMLLDYVPLFDAVRNYVEKRNAQ